MVQRYLSFEPSLPPFIHVGAVGPSSRKLFRSHSTTNFVEFIKESFSRRKVKISWILQ